MDTIWELINRSPGLTFACFIIATILCIIIREILHREVSFKTVVKVMAAGFILLLLLKACAE